MKGIVLGSGVIRGRVLAPEEKALPRLVRVPLEGPLSGSADVAADGTFEIAAALAGAYRVTAVEPGHVSEPVEVVVPHAGMTPTVGREEDPSRRSDPPPRSLRLRRSPLAAEGLFLRTVEARALSFEKGYPTEDTAQEVVSSARACERAGRGVLAADAL